MNSVLMALGIITVAALLSVGLADHTRWVSYRDLAAYRVERAADRLLESCLRGCTDPPQTEVCLTGGVVRLTVTVDWRPRMLRGLTPVEGTALVDPHRVDLSWLDTLATCP